jgi:hypothetical protein
MARVIGIDATARNQTFRVVLESMPSGAAKDDIVLHEESLNRGTVIRNCSTSDIGTENSSTRFRCADVKFQNNRFEDFHFFFSTESTGPRSRGIVLENNRISDADFGSVAIHQALDWQLRGNQLVGVTLDFRDESTGIQLEGNRWKEMKDGQMSVKASKGSTVHLGAGNQRDGKNPRKWVASDRTSVVK